MKNLLIKLKRRYYLLLKDCFIVFEKCMAFLFDKRKMKILFSNNKKDWEILIKESFSLLQHEISFEELTPENIVKYNVVVPLSINDIKNLNNYHQLINKNPIPIPSNKSILICDNKDLFNKTLIQNDFECLIPECSDTLPVPYIFKKKVDEFGQNSHIVLSSDQEKELLNNLPIQNYYRQKLILGKYEYATHILFKKNKIVCWINIEYAFEKEVAIKGKDNIIYTRKCYCPYIDIFSSILNLINFEGICCINYKIQNNKPMILEINPRFGGSLAPFFFSFIRHLD